MGCETSDMHMRGDVMKTYIFLLKKSLKWLLIVFAITCTLIIATTFIDYQRMQNYKEPLFYIDSRVTFFVGYVQLTHKYGIAYECLAPNYDIPPEFAKELSSFNWEAYYNDVSFNLTLAHMPNILKLLFDCLHIKTIFLVIPFGCILAAWFKRISCPALPAVVSSVIVLFLLLFVWRQELSGEIDNTLDIAYGGYHMLNTLQFLITTFLSCLILPLHCCKEQISD